MVYLHALTRVLLFQRPSILGHRVESKIADLVQNNHSLKKFGIFMEIPGSRLRVLEYVQRNNDQGQSSVHIYGWSAPSLYKDAFWHKF